MGLVGADHFLYLLDVFFPFAVEFVIDFLFAEIPETGYELGPLFLCFILEHRLGPFARRIMLTCAPF